METETFKSNSLLARYYKFVFNGTLPETTCDLYRNILWSIIFFPLHIISAIPLWKDENWDRKNLFKKTFNGVMIWIGLFIAALLGLVILYKSKFTFWEHQGLIVSFFIGLITFIIVVGGVGLIIIALIWAGIELYDRISEYNSNKKWERRAAALNEPVVERKPSKIRVIIDTLKNKYCSKITWE